MWVMLKRVTIRRLCIEVIFAAVIGSAEIVIWQRADADTSYNRYLFIYPIVVGLLLGTFGRGPVWIIGPATMLFYPVGMLIDMFKGGHALDLWPISLVFFGVSAFVGFVGAAIGRGAQRCWLKWSSRNDA